MSKVLLEFKKQENKPSRNKSNARLFVSSLSIREGSQVAPHFTLVLLDHDDGAGAFILLGIQSVTLSRLSMPVSAIIVAKPYTASDVNNDDSHL